MITEFVSTGIFVEAQWAFIMFTGVCRSSVFLLFGFAVIASKVYVCRVLGWLGRFRSQGLSGCIVYGLGVQDFRVECMFYKVIAVPHSPS